MYTHYRRVSVNINLANLVENEHFPFLANFPNKNKHKFDSVANYIASRMSNDKL